MPEQQGGRQGGREDSLTPSLTKLPALSSDDAPQGGGSEDHAGTRNPADPSASGTSGLPPSLPSRRTGRRVTGSPRVTSGRRRLVSLSVAAEYADVSTRTLRRYISDGRLTGYRVGPRLLKVDLNEVEAIATPIPTVTPHGAAARPL